MTITEINITPIKPKNGLVAFASCVIEHSLFLGSIGIMTKLNGLYRLTYPTKKLADTDMSIYHPINSQLGSQLEEAIVGMFEEVMKGNNVGYHRADANP